MPTHLGGKLLQDKAMQFNITIYHNHTSFQKQLARESDKPLNHCEHLKCAVLSEIAEKRVILSEYLFGMSSSTLKYPVNDHFFKKKKVCKHDAKLQSNCHALTRSP